jgi:DNA-binding response OmpR family regulator
MLDVHVSNIRTKLEAIGASPRIIRTRRNLGYIINVNTESRSRS